MPTRSRLVHAVVARVALLSVTALASLSAAPPVRQAGQPATTAQTPSFRASANFVQVDVYPTANGRSVADLSKDDFEVFEDGVAQSVATFEHVSVRASGPDQPRRDPSSTRNERELAADPHNRLFVIFLDSYHVTDPVVSHARGAESTMRLPGSAFEGRPRGTKPLGPQPIDKAIVNFLERVIGPNDLVAAMSPEMDAGGMTFGRRPQRFAEWVTTAWARRFAWDDMDPEEERWALCYPPDLVGDPYRCFSGIWEEMVVRRREKLTLRALDDTVTRLGTLREGRKAVLLVSEGWSLFRPDQNLARQLPLGSFPGCADPVPPVSKGIRVGPDGTLQRGVENPGQSDRSACDAARVELAWLDNESSYRQLLDRANRQNVTFYPIDPRGLAVFDAPFDAASTNGSRPEAVNADLNSLRGHLDALRNLASATDGFMSETNDLDASMKRVADDLSEYYLLGYNSTNTALDGKFRRISVRVKRSGVSVRARRGYLAATDAEVRARAAAAAPVDVSVREREAALAGLGKMPTDLPLRVKGGFDFVDSAPSLWTVVELGEVAARLIEWQEGGEAELTVTSADGSAVASGKAPLSAASRGFLWRPPSKPLEAGDYVVRVSARPTVSGSASIGGQVRVTLPAASDQPGFKIGTSRVLRRGPSTGLAFVPTVDDRFRRVERVRVEVSLSGETAISARMLDRRGQPLGVQAGAVVREQDGGRVVVAEAALASLAPGDYLMEVALGDGASRQTVLTAIRIVP